MKLLICIVAAASAGLVQGQQALGGGASGEFLCDTVQCQNGMFNQGRCKCECIPPYCPDLKGDCTTASNNCGGNPWTECVKGVNCPWWKNILKQDSCTTGWEIPVNTWDIYTTRQACCDQNFPYSDTCNGPLAPEPPSKHPTIVAEEDDFELVPVRFDILGISDDFSIMELKEEMKTVLKRILLLLTDKVEGLSVVNVEQTVPRSGEGNVKGRVSAYFNVEIIRVDGTNFGPLIIQAIRDDRDEILRRIQTFADTMYIGSGEVINICAMQNGAFGLCVEDITTPAPVPPPPVALVRETDPPQEEGLDGWAIALIVIFVLLFTFCVGYATAVICFGVNFFRDHDDRKEIHNNVYIDEDHDRSLESRRSRNMLAIENGIRASGHTSRLSDHSRAIVLAKPEEDEESFRIPNDNFTDGASKYIRGAKSTYGTKHLQGRDPTMYIPGQEDKPDPRSPMITQGRDPTMYIPGGRDPTMYIPGQEDKPDPNLESGWFSDSSSSRRYREDPPLKPKREPTMYFGGKRSDEDPPLKPLRDPTMYRNGHREADLYSDVRWDVSSRQREEEYDHPSEKSLKSNVSYHEKGEREHHREPSVATQSTRNTKRSTRTKQSGRSKNSYVFTG